MKPLHNRISRKELKEKILRDPTPRMTVSFYRYFSIDAPQEFRDFLYKELLQFGVLGRIYLAPEGINAQVSLPTAYQHAFSQFLDTIPQLKELRLNVAVEDDGKSFFVLDIKVRKKIVADGIHNPLFDMSKKGAYVDADQMNKMMEDENTIVIDMRNHYEYEVGHFQNAIPILSDTFREQLPMAAELMQEKKEKNIIMYCTGGIRCEKASAYLLHHGFNKVYHLEGGIINYARQIKEQGLESKFIGKNFVFDNRLGERITSDIIAACHQCGSPADQHTNCRNEACHLLFIQCENCAQTYEGCCSAACQETIHLPETERKVKRKGVEQGRKVFNKARSRKPG